jgi:hypothetical protein
MALLKKSDEFFNEGRHSNDPPFNEELQKEFPNGTQPLESHKLPEIELPQDNRYNSDFAKELGNILAPHDFYRRFARLLGKRGGAAGKGEAKRRTSEQARAAVNARWAKARESKKNSSS